MENKNKKIFYQLISKILNIPKRNIKDSTSPKNTASWDSFNSLMIFAELEKKFKINFNSEQILKARDIKDIKLILRSHNISF